MAALSSKSKAGPTQKKYNELPLDKKVELIKKYQAPGRKESYESLGKEFGIGRSSVGRIVRDAKTHLANYDEKNLKNKRCRKLKKTENSDLNVLMKEWFDSARAKHIPVSGPLVQEQALKYAKELGLQNFQASYGWLYKWREAYNISFKTVSGESADADIEAAQSFKAKIPEICQEYATRDIYNADETGLYIKGLPNKSLVQKGEDCKAGKFVKDRLTLLVFCNQDGTDKRKMLVIGKSKQPCALKNIPHSNLPVTWEHNKKAWMTRVLLEPVLLKFDREMGLQKRKVLLFLDNASSHKFENLHLMNVKLVFFPPNVTSQIQPLDLGIIRVLKAHYKKKLLQKILSTMEQANNPSVLLKGITLLDSIHWIAESWNEISQETIQKCFQKAGFLPFVSDGLEGEMEAEEVGEEAYPEIENLEEEEEEEVELFAGITELIRKIPGSDLTASEFIAADDVLPDSEDIIDTEEWSKDLLHDYVEKHSLEMDAEILVDSDSDSDTDEPELPNVTHKEAENCIQLLRAYSVTKQPELVNSVIKLETEFASFALERKLSGRQTSLQEFFGNSS